MSSHSDWPRSGAPFERRGDDDAAAGALQGARRYRKTALLGEGGMGRVWLGWDEAIRRNVAIKEPLDGAIDRLRREIMLTATLDHPGVAAVYDVFHERARPLFVMALVRGETLSARLSRPDVDRAAAVRYVLKACEVVAHAHRQGVIHRDLSPANVLVEGDDAVRVIDWGMALTLDEAALHPCSCGTRGYIAPEQRAGAPLDRRADVWSLGALLYTALYDKAPREPLVRDTSIIGAVCGRAMSPRPEDRYDDAGQMAQDILRWFDGRRVEAFRGSTWRLLAWLAKQHRVAVITGATVALLLGCSVLSGVASTRAEARRARQAEEVATAQARLAHAARARAQREAEGVKRASRALRLTAAQSSMQSGDVSAARAHLDAARLLGPTPEEVGMRMRLALVPRMVRHGQRALAPCRGRRILTYDPRLTLCYTAPATLEAHHDQGLLWRVDLLDRLASSGNEAIKDWRIDRERLVVRANLQGVWAISLRDGDVTRVHAEFPDFASTSTTQLLQPNGTRWASGEPIPCPGRAVRAYEEASGRTYVCKGGHIIGLLDGDTPRHLYDGSLGHVVHYALVGAEERWVATAQGDLWPLDQTSRRASLGSPIRAMLPLGESPYLLVQSWQDGWRVLDTKQGDWIASFGDDVTLAWPTAQGAVQVVRNGQLEIWRPPSTSIMRTYKGDDGFVDLAWSPDGTSLAAGSGGAKIHWIEPFGHRHAEPVVHGRDVTKSVAWLPKGGVVAVNALPERGQRLSRFERQGDHLVRADVCADTPRGPHAGRRVEWMHPGHLLVATTTGSLYMLPLDCQEGRTALSKRRGEVTDLDTDDQRRRALSVGPEHVRVIEAGTIITEFAAPEGAYYGSLAADGRIALGGKHSLWLYDTHGALQRRLDVPTLTALTWRPDSDHLVTGHLDGSVIVWRAGAAEMVAKASLHRGRVAALDCSPDGMYLASASWDTTIKLLGFEPVDRQDRPVHLTSVGDP